MKGDEKENIYKREITKALQAKCGEKRKEKRDGIKKVMKI